MNLADASPWVLTIVFVSAALAVGVAGTRMAGLADRLADRTGMGEALAGALFLGVTTSLPGITASVTAALDGFPALAISNAMGGIAVQTAFLSIADLFHRRANLEHAAASIANVLQGALLVALLSIVLVVASGPDVTVGHVHPGTALLIAAYVGGIRLVMKSSSEPMWTPRRTNETRLDRAVPDAKKENLVRLWLAFAGVAAVVLVAGFFIGRTAGILVSQTGINETVMGGVFTAISTSVPELVTTIAAVRRGALTLAVSDIVGGNAFDVLFVCVADMVYLRGSVYHAAGAREVFLIALTILLNVIVLMGLVHRERRGIANIGFESVLVLLAYVGGIALIARGTWN